MVDFKYKVTDIAKDFGISTKKVIETFAELTGETRKTGATFEENEVNALMEALTRETAVKDLGEYLASGKEPQPVKQETKKPEAKPQAKKEEPKPEAAKPQPKQPKQPEAPKAEPKAEQAKPAQNAQPKAAQPKAAQPKPAQQEKRNDKRNDNKQAEKRSEKRVTMQELASETGIKEPVATEQVKVDRAQVSVDTRTVDVNVDKFSARYDDLADSRNMPSKRKNAPTGKKEKFNNRNNRRGQQFGRRVGIQIPLQSRRAVEIQKSLSLRKPQRQQAQPLRRKAAVESADLIQQPLLAPAWIRKQAPGLDAGQRRRGLPHNHFFRHQQAPCAAYLSRMPRSADRSCGVRSCVRASMAMMVGTPIRNEMLYFAAYSRQRFGAKSRRMTTSPPA